MLAIRVFLILASSMWITVGASAETLVIPTSADTWIEGLDDNDNHGSELATAICPTADYWIYVKFDVGSVPGTIDAAELRMTRFDGDHPEEISLYLITDDSWTEGGLNGVNRPAPTNPPNASSLAVGLEHATGYDQWTSPSFTTTVALQAQSDGIVSLMLREDPAPMLDIRYYRSRDAPVPEANKPLLVLEVSPGEVEALTLTGTSPTTLSWEAGSGTAYDVATGLLSELRVDEGTDSATCLAEAHGSTSYNDTRPAPPKGDGYYYVVRARIGSTVGSYGEDSSGAERMPFDACP